MFFINNPNLRKLEAFMQEVPNFPPKGVKVDLDKLEDEILLFDVEKVIVSFKQHKGKERIMKFTLSEIRGCCTPSTLTWATRRAKPTSTPKTKPPCILVGLSVEGSLCTSF